jgi:acyl-coenzyme A synthetase/AMP-(fatty) acid ligase
MALIAWRAGRPLTVGRLLQDAQWLARRLPRAGYQVNLCEDRYLFLVGLVAALTRKQTLLLPPSRTPDDLLDLRQRHPSIYCLSDRPGDFAGLEALGIEGLPDRVGDEHPRLPRFPSHRLLAELHTSGSTGAGTVHVKRWGTMFRGAELTGARLGLGPLAGASMLATVPPQHMYGLETSVLLPLRWGLSVAAEQPLFSADVGAALDRLPAPRILVTTPLHLRSCLVENAQLPELAFILSATAPLEAELAQQAEQRYHTRVLEIYGSTETGAVATRRPSVDADWEPLPDMVLHRRDGRSSFAGGHLPEAVAVGDLIEPQPDGRFRLIGRDSDLVKIAGKRASLAYLNRRLLEIEGVSDGAFFLPAGDRPGITRLACLVVAPALEEAQILAALRRKLVTAFLPRPLLRVDSLPRTATGKLPRQALLDLFNSLSRPHGQGSPA